MVKALLVPIQYSLKIAVLTCALLSLLACEQDVSVPSTPALNEVLPPGQEQTLDTYQMSTQLWQVGQEALFIALGEVNRLHNAIDALLSDPSDASLTLAREQWQKAFTAFARSRPLLQTGLIDEGSDPQSTIAHWPFYPGFIDSFGPYRDSGIVNAIDTPLSSRLVRTYHQQFEENELLLGFYPIAYLLWSEYEPRSAADFLPLTKSSANYKAASVKLTQLPQNRRRQLLRLQSEWLLLDVKALYDSWVEGELHQAYHQQLPDERLRVITDSLLLSLEGMLVSTAESAGLPTRFVQNNTANRYAMVADVGRYYFEYRLADYWLTVEERERAQLLLSQLQQPGTEDWPIKVRTFIALLSPDTLIINPTDQ